MFLIMAVNNMRPMNAPATDTHAFQFDLVGIGFVTTHLAPHDAQNREVGAISVPQFEQNTGLMLAAVAAAKTGADGVCR